LICEVEITSEMAKKILVEGKSDLIEGFISKRTKRAFSAYLVLGKDKTTFEFPPREAPADATRFEVVEGVVAICPKHNIGIIETPTHFQPENSSTGCRLSIAREMSKREITREDAKQMIEKKSIGPFDDFISKKSGKPFSATLYVKGNESIGYRFNKK